MRNRKGHMLLEITLVLAIIGILGLMVLPRLGSLRGFQERKEMEKTYLCLKEARNKSVEMKLSVTFFVTDSTYGYRDGSGKILYEESFSYLKPAPLGTGNRNITFTKNGKPSSDSAGRIYLRGKIRDFTFVIQPVATLVTVEESRGSR